MPVNGVSSTRDAERQSQSLRELRFILQIHRPLMQRPVGRRERQCEAGGGLVLYITIERAGRDARDAPHCVP